MGSQRWYRSSVGPVEFFEMHPQLLDADLRQLINLGFLVKDAYQAQRMGQKAFSKAAKQEMQASFSSSADVFAAIPKSASGTRSAKRRKSPRQNRVSLELGDRHKSPRSSSNRHDEARN